MLSLILIKHRSINFPLNDGYSCRFTVMRHKLDSKISVVSNYYAVSKNIHRGQKAWPWHPHSQRR